MGVHRREHHFKTSVIKALQHSENNRLRAPEVEIVNQDGEHECDASSQID